MRTTMALTQGNIVVYGPFTLTAKEGQGSSDSKEQKAYSGLKSDAVTFDVEKKLTSVEFEDGTRQNGLKVVSYDAK